MKWDCASLGSPALLSGMGTFIRKARLLVIPLLMVLSAANGMARSHPKWILTWSDEFNAPDGTPVNSQKWTAETGGKGWGNDELEYYTANARNARQEGGALVIEAIREKYTGPDGLTRNY